MRFIMKTPTILLSKLVYDVDNRYVDLSIRDVGDDGKLFVLMLNENANDVADVEVDMYLTREDLQLIIDKLTQVLQK
jgi:hypothetical protein